MSATHFNQKRIELAEPKTYNEEHTKLESVQRKFKIIGPESVPSSQFKEILGDEYDSESLDTIAFSDLADLLNKKETLISNSKEKITFENLNRTIITHPHRVVHPKTVEELQEIIKGAVNDKRRVRVVGAGHSWTPVFAEDDAVMIVMDNFKGKFSKDVSGEESEFTITFGVAETIRDVNKYCRLNGLAVPTNVVMDHVGFGGLISMGCHGVGWNSKTISDLCVGMKLVDGTGKIRNFSKKTNSPDEWAALIVNLGLFGVIYEFTISVAKNFNVKVHDYKTPSRNIFGEGSENALKKIVETHHSTQIFWIPFNNDLWIKTFSRTNDHANVWEGKYVRDSFTNWIQMNFGMKTEETLTRALPLTKFFLQSQFSFFANDSTRCESIAHAIHWEKHLDDIKIMCMEFALPFSASSMEDWAKIGQCVRYVQRRVQELAVDNKYPLNLALEMRFVTNSDGFMSSCYGNENTVFMELVSSERTPYFKEFSAEVARKWIEIFPKARPHWAKWCHHIPGITEHIRKQMVSNGSLKKFLKAKKKLQVDPFDIFYTQWIGNILEPKRFSPFVNHDEPLSNMASISVLESTKKSNCTLI